MNHTFCLKCSFKNHYEFSIPRFCGGCQRPLNRADDSDFNAHKKEAPKPKRLPTYEDDDDPEDDDPNESKFFDKDSLAKDWDVNINTHRFDTFHDLISNPAPRDNSKRASPVAKVKSETLVKQSMKECAKVRSTREFGG